MLGDLRAVLDIGSNTIRLLIARTGSSAPREKVHYQHHIARLGQGLQQTGQLSEAGISRALLALEDMVSICQDHHIQAESITAVATAAVREAENGQAFVERARVELGLTIQVISGDVEAGLALQGAKEGVNHVGHDMLLFDIGGGSTEFTRVSQGQIKDSMSLKLGVVRLTESLLSESPTLAHEYQMVKHAVGSFVDDLERFWGVDKVLPKYLVGTAGTVTTLAAIAQDMQVYDAQKINNYHISQGSFYALQDRILGMTNQQRLGIPALEKGREDVIVAGLAIIEVLFERWEYDQLIAVDSGLLEGLIAS